GEPSPGEHAPSEGPPDVEVTSQEALDEALSSEALPAEGLPGESTTEDVDMLSVALGDDAGDESEVSPSPDKPDASAVVMDEGEEHDEP
ncbi:MAG: hypothetical protein ACP5J4_11985, partial [Anaerolineae bacterium]